MKVLLVTPGFPAPPTTGGSQRAFHLLRLLARHHEVHLFSLVGHPPAPEAIAITQPWCSRITLAPVPGRSLRGRLRDLVAASEPDLVRRLASAEACALLVQVLQREAFDVVQVEGLEACAEVLRAFDTNGRPAPPLVLDAFNAEYLLQGRAFLVDLRAPRRWPAAAYSLVQWQKLRRYERDVCRRAAATLAVSKEDQRALLALDPLLTVVLAPHGVDTERYRPSDATGDRRGTCALLFTGTMDFRPNVDAVTWFCGQILPRIRERLPDVRLTIVGRNPTARVQALAGPAVEVTGSVPDDLPFFQWAATFVLPMRYGGGVRLKLLQALASGLPVVSTPVGAEGIAARDDEHLLLAERPEEFAQAVIRTLTDEALAARLGAAGRALVEASFSWEETASVVTTVYGDVARRSQGAGA